jgi:hypothetical protein
VERAGTSDVRPRARGVLANLALLVCSCAVTVATLEVASRIAVPQWRGLVAQNFMTATPSGVLAGVPDFDGRISSLFGEFDVPLQLDARGFRNLPDADPAAPLAFIGDSFCLGWGVTREQTYSVLLSKRLGLPSYNYCTVGADLLDDLNVLRTWMPPGRRTTVLSVTFENDVLAYPEKIDDVPSAAVQGLSRSASSVWLLQNSALFDVGTTLLRQSTGVVALVRRLGLMSGVPSVSRDGIDPIAASVQMVDRIQHVAGPGPFIVLLVPPRPGQVAFIDYDAFVAALGRKGFNVVNPRAVPGLKISTIPRDGHWDAAMHAAIVPVLAERIRRVSGR